VEELSPSALIARVPAKMGFSKDMLSELDEAALKGNDDGFNSVYINFAQFHFVVLRMTEVAYPSLYKEDATVAFDKMLRECILPLFVWINGHHKLGTVDPLLSDARIPVLTHVYAPNIFRLFLFYSTDLNNRTPPLQMPFPETAKVCDPDPNPTLILNRIPTRTLTATLARSLNCSYPDAGS